jgi:hypothetical protein
MTTAIDKAMHGSAQAPLNSEQRRTMMARLIVPAHRKRMADGLTGEDLDTWRYEEIFKACGRGQLRACTQADYPRLVAHFLRILGRVEQAREWDLRVGCSGLAVARQKLRAEMANARDAIGNVEAYVGSICRRQFGCDMRDATEKQTWSLYFTLRNRARKKGGRR